MHLCLIDWGVHLPSIYICIVLDLAVGVVVCKTSMLKCLGVHLSSIHRYCPRYSNGCSSMQGIYAWLTGGSICLLYICIVLDLAVGVVVCKASMLEWLGIHLSSICMHCPRSNSGCSSMQDICAQLTEEDLCWIALCYANIFGAAVFNATMLAWLGGPSAFYICALS